MKNLILTSLMICFSLIGFSKVKFYNKEYKGELTYLAKGEFCNGNIGKVGNALDFNLDETVAPYANNEEKQALIDQFTACLTTGLKVLSGNKPNVNVLNVMIPQGLFIETTETNYVDEYYQGGGKESKVNFQNFVEKCGPIFNQFYTDLKVYVWNWNW